MTEEIKAKAAPAPQDPADLSRLAAKPEATKPDTVSGGQWRRYRVASGNMVVIRSHFKSIYLIPMAIISLLCAVVVAFSSSSPAAGTWMGLLWVGGFCFYMNIFIFDWTRAWTYALLVTAVAIVAVAFAVDSESFPVWGTLAHFLANLNFKFTLHTYLFFFIFFGLAASLSYVKTRFNYVVFERNELQVYRNAWFGDRERISLLNPRSEVVIPDMLEYFHPFYRAGSIIVHAPNRTIVLPNVLQIRRIERNMNRLSSALNVNITQN